MTEEQKRNYWKKVDKTDGCWLWTGAVGWRTTKGTGSGCFCIDGKNHRAHRLSYEMHHGPIPKGLYVLHRCENTLCVNPDHLYLGTRGDSVRNTVKKGTHRSGNHRKLTREQALDIRERALGGEPLRSIADDYGLAYNTVHQIKSGRSWKHL